MTSPRRRIRVARFGGPEVLELVTDDAGEPRRGRVRVRITHASLGSTDALARQGGYLLQPRAGFTPGYDFLGVIERTTADAAARGLVEGARVAACLPRMGAHANLIDVPARLLVPVPDALDSAVAATLPLDVVTAALAWSLMHPKAGRAVLVQGASGSVGRRVAAQAIAAGHPVFGTASASNRDAIEALGATWIDYREAGWIERLRAATGGVSAAVDHTGDPAVRRAVSPDGKVVRLSFVGRRGHERGDTVRGGLGAVGRSFAHPAERVVSVPLFVATRPGRYRALLAGQLERAARGEIVVPEVEVLPLGDARAGHARLDAGLTGHKLVLAP